MNMNKHLRHYLGRAAAGELVFPRCEECAAVFMPPRAACPACGTDALGWTPVGGAQGTIYSISRHSNEGSVALCEFEVLNTGTRFYGQLVGPGNQQAQIGQPVELTLAECTVSGMDAVDQGQLIPSIKLVEN
ncbi:hypothetical protein CQ019_06100 [Arthrobacter sp. MYb229]|uniref:Zn-ribbon domain-containing OB-fold protein n=1 Tax=unclassified Arthrobacter TaxID=235627 RepID=UPI000CFABCAB|nr:MULTISPECIES: zinc ribbon domain-containing protein [unclassified Arthrobacter]PRA06918.1 hypothetical protein CQ019_06100 [Arthrobacter sp. MYb229]PRB47866.1 hypothetical protein CQ013_15895 [Arthrobacter sp. MYb216]